jgi:hypothetical protein
VALTSFVQRTMCTAYPAGSLGLANDVGDGRALMGSAAQPARVRRPPASVRAATRRYKPGSALLFRDPDFRSRPPGSGGHLGRLAAPREENGVGANENQNASANREAHSAEAREAELTACDDERVATATEQRLTSISEGVSLVKSVALWRGSRPGPPIPANHSSGVEYGDTLP